MSISTEISAAGVDPTRPADVVRYIANLPIPRDRREGLLRLWAADQKQALSLDQIETVRLRSGP